MSKQQDKRNVPDIRFPGFEGEWESPKAGSLFKNSVSKGFEGLPIFSVTQANGMVERASLDREFDDISKPEGNRLVKKNDIAYNMMRMWQGAVGVAPVDCMISPAYVVLTPNSDVSSQFYYKMFKSKKYLYLLTSYSQGITSDRLRLYYKDFANMHLPHPALKEQQKIASFLSDVDTKIEKLIHKKELLEQYKKGVMQKLFSREIRFKDENGKEFPEWEEKRFQELYSFKSTNSLSRDKLNYLSGSIYNVHYGDIHTRFNSLFDISKETVPFINEVIDLSKINKDSLLQEGDLVIADASEDYADIGKAIEIINLNNKRVLSGLHTILAKRGNTLIANGYMGYFMKSFNYCLDIKRIAQGTKVLGLSSNRLKEVIIKFPVIEEQNKIVSFLISIDGKISYIDKKIISIQKFKKRLLHKMFV